MIFYKNLKKHKQVKNKNLVFSIFDGGVVSNTDDSVAKPNACKSFYNLSYVDGALKNGLGFADLAVPSSEENLEDTHTYNFASKIDAICGLWLDRWFNNNTGTYQYQIILSDTKNYLWGVPLIDEDEGFIWTKSDKLESSPLFQCAYRIDNTDCCLFFTNEGLLYLSTVREGIYPNVPPFISCVVHYDNFFGITNTNRNTLIYTTNLNITKWQDEEKLSTIEFLDNRGAFTKLVAFNDYVYLFRENGITKLSLYTTRSEFSFTHLYTSTSKIYENSVCVCGSLVFFMTRDGLYTFNGNSVSKVADEYDKFFKNLDNLNCTSACLDGKYYFASKCNFDDGEKVGCENGDYVNNCLFEIDVKNFELNLYRGVDIRKLLALDNPYMSKMCACFYSENKQRVGELNHTGSTFETSTQKCWKSFSTDLDLPGKRKRMKEVYITTLYDCTLTIISDEEEKTYNFAGKSEIQREKINICGKIFQFIFKTTEKNCDIKKPMVVFDVEK